MSVAQGELNDVALVAYTVTDTDQFECLLVAFTDTDNHIVDKRTVETVVSLLLTSVDGSVLIDRERQDTILVFHLHGRVNPLLELTLGAFHCNDVLCLIETDGYASRDVNW